MEMKRFFIVIVVLNVVYSCVLAQGVKIDSTSVYNINKRIEIPITAGLFVGSYFGFSHLSNKGGLSKTEVLSLDTRDIWGFDRFAAEQDASGRNKFQSASDLTLNISLALPLLLGLDKSIREDWMNMLVMYVELHGVNNIVYVAGASLSNRKRPFVYNNDVPLNERIAKETENSFFSGHTSTVAAASFFMAKVYSDYHPELGNRKYLLYGAAILPSALIGYYRVKAMKHFPSDVITGTIVGAAVGILVPHFHKRKNKSGFTLTPIAGSMTGVTAKYTFK